eukprot:COSAG01_NODE_21554_length_896_cov_4.824341_1_plen_183_part_00
MTLHAKCGLPAAGAAGSGAGRSRGLLAPPRCCPPPLTLPSAAMPRKANRCWNYARPSCAHCGWLQAEGLTDRRANEWDHREYPCLFDSADPCECPVCTTAAVQPAGEEATNQCSPCPEDSSQQLRTSTQAPRKLENSPSYKAAVRAEGHRYGGKAATAVASPGPPRLTRPVLRRDDWLVPSP